MQCYIRDPILLAVVLEASNECLCPRDVALPAARPGVPRWAMAPPAGPRDGTLSNCLTAADP
jgi:hypothetical protein